MAGVGLSDEFAKLTLPITSRRELAEVLGRLTFLEVWDLRREGKYRLRDREALRRIEERLGE